MNQVGAPTREQHPGVHAYSLLCIGALSLLVLALVLRRPDAWALFPALVGGLALLLRWRTGPILVLLAVVLLLWAWWLGSEPGWLGLGVVGGLRRLFFGDWSSPVHLPPRGLPSRDEMPLSDLLLAFSVVSYAAGQYRLQALLVRVFPSEPRPTRRVGPAPSMPLRAIPPPRRAPEAVTGGEIVLLLAGVAASCGTASLFWVWLQRQKTEFPLPVWLWQAILALWLWGGGVLAAAGLLRYLALRRWSRAEAQLYLQDMLWHETRREQRRLNRWLAWAWLRRRRREERKSP